LLASQVSNRKQEYSEVFRAVKAIGSLLWWKVRPLVGAYRPENWTPRSTAVLSPQRGAKIGRVVAVFACRRQTRRPRHASSHRFTVKIFNRIAMATGINNTETLTVTQAG
jgi:hypothetical protein